ncbi:gliding motility-associated C-terminal domain-containing protein, partial [Bacteroidota bacterium]
QPDFHLNIDSVTCNGAEDGKITPKVDVGTAPYDYYLFDKAPWLPPYTPIKQDLGSNDDSTIFEDLDIGLYYIIVDDAGPDDGDMKSGRVYQPDPLVNDSFSIVQDLSCYNSADAQIKANPSGGTQPYTYQWRVWVSDHFEDIPGQTSQILTSAEADQLYRVVISDKNGCGPVEDDIYFFDFFYPDNIPDSITISAVDIIHSCQGMDNGKIDITAIGGTGDLDYAIVDSGSDSTAQEDSNFIDVEPETYTIWVIDENSCQKSSPGHVVDEKPPPTADAGSDAVICENSSYTVNDADSSNSSGVSWIHDGNGNLTNATTLTPTYTADAADAGNTVTLTLTVSGNGMCSDSTDQMTIDVVPRPVADAGSDGAICENSSFTVTDADSSDCAGILWTHNGAGSFDNAGLINPTYTPVAGDAGNIVTLTLTASGNADCADSVDVAYLTIEPVPVADAGSDGAICENSSYTVTDADSSDCAGILWTHDGAGSFDNAGLINPTYTADAADAGNIVTITLTAFGNADCADSVSEAYLTIEPVPVADAGSDGSICENSSFTVTDADSSDCAGILWTHDGAGSFDNTGLINPTYTPVAGDAGNIVTLTLTASGNGDCADSVDVAYLDIKAAPVADAGSDGAICENSSFTVTDADSSNCAGILWTHDGAGSFDNAGLINPTYTADAADAGNIVTITLTAFGNADCADSVSEAYLDIKAAAEADAGSDGSICENSFYTVFDADSSNCAGINWIHDGNGFLDDLNIINPTYTAVPADAGDTVTMTLTAIGNSDCADSVDQMIIIVHAKPIVYAGTDTTICYGSSIQIADADTTNSNGLVWTTTGDGTFDFDNIIDPTYTPGATDLSNGSVELSLEAQSANCVSEFDTIEITIPPELTVSVGKEKPFDISSSTIISVKIKVEDRYHFGDLSMYLQAPDGSQVALKEMPFSPFCNFGDTLDVEFTTEKSIDDTLDPCIAFPGFPGTDISGTFAATGDWSVLNGKDPANGAWAVKLVDIQNHADDTSELTFAEISFIDTNISGDTTTVLYTSGTISVPINQPSSGGVTIYQVPLGLQAQCFGDPAEGIITVAGGTPPYGSYVWSSPPYAIDNDTVYLLAGSYTLTVTDDLGCIATTTFDVSQPNEIIIDSLIHTDSLLCFGDSDGQVLTGAHGGVGTLEYAIDGGPFASDTLFTGLAAGDHTLSIRDITGCQKDTIITIHQPDSFYVDSIYYRINSAPLVNDAEIEIFESGGIAPYEYSVDDSTNFEPTDGFGGYTYVHPGEFSGLPGDSTYYIFIRDANGCYAVGDTINLVPLRTTLVPDSVWCNGGNNGSIDLTVTGGSGQFTYLWSNAETTEDIATLTANRYYVTVTDTVNNRYIVDSADVEEPPALVITLDSLRDVDCYADGVVGIIVTGGKSNKYTYTWTSNSGTFVPADTNFYDGLDSGTYYVTVTDVKACTILDTFRVKDPYPIVISQVIDTNYTCHNTNDGKIYMTASGGRGPLEYIIGGAADDTNTTGIFLNLLAGKYGIKTVDSIGCENAVPADSVDIINPDTISIISVTVTDETCPDNNNGILEINATGGTGVLMYSKDDIIYQFKDSIENLDTGNYRIYIKDSNECKIDSGMFRINGPDRISLTSIVYTDSLLCNGDNNGSITINATGGKDTLYYSIDGSFPDIPEDTINVFTGLTAGDYNIWITDKNSCPFEDNDTLISIYEPPLLTIPDIEITQITCNDLTNGQIKINTTGGTLPKTFRAIKGTDTTFVVANNDTATIASLDSGDYNIEVLDANGCVTIYIPVATIINPDTISITAINITNETCAGDSNGEIEIIASGGTGAFQYNLNNTGWVGTSTFTGLAIGSYDVYVRDANLCQVDSLNNFVNSPPPITTTNRIIDSSSYICNGDSNLYIEINATGDLPLKFRLNGGAWDTDSTFSNLGPGTYSIDIKDKNGCMRSDTSFTFVGPDLFTIESVDITNITCNDNTDGIVTINTTGGSLPKTFRLIEGTDTTSIVSYNDTVTFTNLDSGDYKVQVRDSLGCEKIHFSLATVINPDTISISAINITDESCPGDGDGEIAIVASGGTGSLEYRINNTSWFGTSTFTGLGQGTYSVYVRDINLCQVDSANNIITSPPAIITSNRITDSSSYKCNGDSNLYVEINATGDGPLQFRLNNGPWDTDSTFSNLGPGTYTIDIQDNNGCIQFDTSFTFVGPPQLFIDSVTYVNNSQPGVDDGKITIYASGGKFPYSFSVDSGKTFIGNSGLFTNLPGDSIYYPAIIDDNKNGCVINWPDSILIGAFRVDTIIFNDITCNGYSDGSIEIFAEGGSGDFRYIWNNDTTTNSDSITLSAGTYYIDVLDVGFSIVIKDTIVLTEPSPITYDAAVNDFLCHNHTAGGSIIISNVQGGNAGGYFYDWDGPNGYDSQDQNVLGLDTGIHQLTISDILGCTAIFSDTIFNPDSIIVYDVTHEDIICYGDSTGEISSSAIGGTGNLTFSIGNGYPDQLKDGDFTGLDSNIYYLQAIDDNGCQSVDTPVVVRQPALPISIQYNISDSLACSYDSDGLIEIVGTVGGQGPDNISNNYSYSWADGSVSTQRSNLIGDYYYLTITDQVNCEEYFSFYIYSPDSLQIDSIRMSMPICNIMPTQADTGQIYIHSMQGGTPFNDGSYRYQWSTGINDTLNFIYGLSGGDYSFTVTDKNDCVSETEIALVPDPTWVINASAGNDTFICEGTSIIMNGNVTAAGNNISSILWSVDNVVLQPNENPVFSPTETTTYTLQAVNNYCQANDTVIVNVYEKIGLNIEKDTIHLTRGLSTQLRVDSTFASYLWYPSDFLDDSSIYNPVARPMPSESDQMIYIISATTEDGCIESDSIRIILDYEYNPPTGFTPNYDGINDEWILPEEDDIEEVVVVNRWGEVVFSSKNYSNKFKGISNKGKELPTGTYYFIITFIDGQIPPQRGSITIIR